jgi:hypothetical protein
LLQLRQLFWAKLCQRPSQNSFGDEVIEKPGDWSDLQGTKPKIVTSLAPPPAALCRTLSSPTPWWGPSGDGGCGAGMEEAAAVEELDGAVRMRSWKKAP